MLNTSYTDTDPPTPPRQGCRSSTSYTTAYYSQLLTPATQKGKTFFMAITQLFTPTLASCYFHLIYLPFISHRNCFSLPGFSHEVFLNHGLHKINTDFYGSPVKSCFLVVIRLQQRIHCIAVFSHAEPQRSQRLQRSRSQLSRMAHTSVSDVCFAFSASLREIDMFLFEINYL